MNGMSAVVLKTKRITLGAIAGTLGVTGFILPIMPGWPFMIFAVFLLSRDVPPVRPVRAWMERRFPWMSAPVLKWEAYLGLGDPILPGAVKADDTTPDQKA